ncbi:MAG: FecR family protein [Lacunisphaera sp.]
MPPDRHDISGDADAVSAIEQQAADWLVLHDHGLSPAQREAFEQWMHASEQHAAVYAELEETWTLIGRAHDASAAFTPSPSASTPITLERSKHRGTPLLWLAAAASVALCIYLAQPATPSVNNFTLTASTEVGGIRSLPLPDGSTLLLNTDSAVAVRFSPSERRVKLVRGEANFQVAKNPARPFIVSAGAIDVRAVGTAFDVRQRPGAVEVLVTEGKVRVDDSVAGKSRLPASSANDGKESVLVAGERAYISLDSHQASAQVVAIAPAEISQVLAWQSHRLEFVATPLADMVVEFNRYNRRKLVIADPRLAARRFGGTFPAGDYEEFVRLLESDFGVVAERDQNEIRLRLAP